MQLSRRTSLLMVVLISGAAACALPGMAVPDTRAALTSAAQTVIAAIELTQRALPATPLPPTAAFTSVSTAPIPTQTATATPGVTVIPLGAQISVSVPTNCRSGPGKVYERVGALLVGPTVPVYGRDPTGMYWYIQNPDSAGDFCWVWGEYATLSGTTSLLPVYTPPPTPLPTFTPTPAPAFQASYTGLDSCSTWWADFKLKNTGAIAFASIGITLKDMATDVVVSGITDGFVDNTGCSSSSKATLQPEKSVTASGPAFSYNPAGHKVRGTITLCSSSGLNGFCVTAPISFTP
jgi:hypothetical protein